MPITKVQQSALLTQLWTPDDAWQSPGNVTLSGVAAGNLVLTFGAWWDTVRSNGNAQGIAADSNGTLAAGISPTLPDTTPAPGWPVSGQILRILAAAAGNHVITPPALGVDGDGLFFAAEFSGGAAGTWTQVEVNSNIALSATPGAIDGVSVSTAGAAQVGDLVVALCTTDGNPSAIGVGAPSGYANEILLTTTTTVNIAAGAGWMIATSAGAQTASWTWADDACQYGQALIAVFRFTPSGPPPQTARPNADVSDGAWTPSTGADNYAVLDETPASDTDFSSTPSNSTLRVGLGTLDTPDAGTQTVRFRANGSPAKKLIVRLIEGASTSRGSLTVDPLPAAFGDYSFNPSGISNYADLDLEFETQDATSPPSNAPAFNARGAGANVTSTTTINVNYPSMTGASGNTALYLVVTGRSNTASTEFAVTGGGWTNIGTLEGGVGTWGADAGTRRVTIFRKTTVTGTESGTITVTLAGTTANTLYASIVRVEPPAAGYTLTESVVSGQDTSAGTAVSIAAGSTLSYVVGDLMLVGHASPSDTGGVVNSPTLTASGSTFGSLTSRATIAVTGGNDHRHVIYTAAVTAAGSAAAPTFAYTASGTSSANASGPALFVRIRAVPPTVFGRVSFAEFEVPAAAAGGGLIADLAATEQGDSFAADATAALASTLTKTEANDTLASAVAAALAASASTTEQGDSFSAGAAATLSASATTAEQSDTLSSAASLATTLTADAAIVEPGDTLASSAAAALAATATPTEQSDTAASASSAALAVAAAPTEQGDVTAAGATAALAATATLTESPDALGATALAVLAAAATPTEQGDALTAGAMAVLTATVAHTEIADSIASSAAASLGATAGIAEQGDTLTAGATAALVATAAPNEQADTLTATLISGVGITATLVEADDSVASAGVASLAASAAHQEQGDSVAAGATAALSTSTAAAEQSDTLSSSATATLAASATLAEQSDTLLADLTLQSGANASIVEQDDSVIASAVAALMASAAISEVGDVTTSTTSAALSADVEIVEASDSIFFTAALLAVINSAIEETSDILASTATLHVGGGGGASAEEIWNYVLSNGLTAAETLAQALAYAQNCCGDA